MVMAAALLLAVLACGRETPERWLEPTTGMELLYVAPHTFRMGSPDELPGREPDETLHEVALSKGFYLGRFEVTQGQWQRVMGDNPSAVQNCGADCPVENVSFHQVQDFLAALAAQTPGKERFRLPTEAEWEAACRAGSATAFATGSTLTSAQANFDGRYPAPGSPAGPFLGRPTPVGSYAANPWGFNDLHGNVWEWCEDWYGPYSAGEARDPTGPQTGERRVIRGGSWIFEGNSARCGLRYTHAEVDKGYSIGFRVVMEPAQGNGAVALRKINYLKLTTPTGEPTWFDLATWFVLPRCAPCSRPLRWERKPAIGPVSAAPASTAPSWALANSPTAAKWG